jgi:glutamyl-Q tRNA(Asp) synthetase
VIVRKEVPTSYHLSVVLDDAVQAITHVVRGTDLQAATDIHAVLAACLGLKTPRYFHHQLLTDEGGQKLSKSRNSHSLAAMREAGTEPGEIRHRLGFAPAA